MPVAYKGPTTVWFYGFYLNPHSAEDSAERMLSWGDLLPPPLEAFEEITYVPLTECAVKDPGFQRMLGEKIAATTFAPKSCLLIRMPPLGTDLADRMRCAVEGIRSAGLPLAQARSKNIFLLGDDPTETMLKQAGARLTLVLHQTFEYWRYTRGLYAEASRIVFHLDADWKRPTEAAKKLLREAFGQAPRFVISVRPSDGEWLAE
jgi:hypothetical protein